MILSSILTIYFLTACNEVSYSNVTATYDEKHPNADNESTPSVNSTHRLVVDDFHHRSDTEHYIDFDLEEYRQTIGILSDFENEQITVEIDSIANLFVWGIPVLHPHSHDIEVSSVEFSKCIFIRSISSIGIINNRLHIQVRQAVLMPYSDTEIHCFCSNHCFFNVELIDPQGMSVTPVPFNNHPAKFSVNNDGEIIVGESPYIDLEPGVPIYTEWVFDIDNEKLSEYKLTAEFSSYDWIELKRTVNLRSNSILIR